MIINRLAAIVLTPLLFLAAANAATVEVKDSDGLRRSAREAKAGDVIRLAPGKYAGGVWIENLHGAKGSPVVIEAADANNPPVFEGGSGGIHIAGCSYVTVRNIAIRGASANGINIDDAGRSDAPAHHITLEGLRISDIGPKGNFDAIKLSGVTDFAVTGCRIEGWGGQSVDMVGCHRGTVERCEFRGKEGFSQSTGPQTKGGCTGITIRRCAFVNAGMRAVNVGGSTGLQFFRPPVLDANGRLTKGEKFEAKDITVDGCSFIGSDAPIALVGVDGATVKNCTFYRPAKWVLRILQETTEEGFVPCRNGRFENNLIVFRHKDVSVVANIGPGTAPQTFKFERNWWYCEDQPAGSKPYLPAGEKDSVYGKDPRLKDPAKGDLTPQEPAAAKYGAGAQP